MAWRSIRAKKARNPSARCGISNWSSRRPSERPTATWCARERKKIERLFAEAKRHLALTRLRLRGLTGARDEFLLAATVQKLKRLIRGVGRAPPDAVAVCGA